MGEPLHLLFAVEEPNIEARAAVEELVAGLNRDREWRSGAVAFVDEVDDESAIESGDAPLWTLGGALDLTTPVDDLDEERAQLEDVEFLVERLAEFSRSGYAFEIEYGGELVGSVTSGEADRSIVAGLIEPWRNRLQSG
jgi:hypothetical protein